MTELKLFESILDVSRSDLMESDRDESVARRFEMNSSFAESSYLRGKHVSLSTQSAKRITGNEDEQRDQGRRRATRDEPQLPAQQTPST